MIVSKAPPLSSISPTKKQFTPGDRIIARTGKLSPDQAKKIRRAVEKYAGVEVRVLVWNALQLKLARWDALTSQWELLADPQNFKLTQAGTANLDCAVVDIHEGDKLMFAPVGQINIIDQSITLITTQLKDWAGKHVEIIK